MMKISGKKIIKSATVPHSLDTTWRRWTTHRGLCTFFGADNQIDLTPGGAFEIYFLMDQPYGLRGSEGCKVLSFLPQRMLSFSWNAPPQFPVIRDSRYQTWVVVELHPVSAGQTQVVLTHLGWPEDPDWDVVYDYFDSAWETVMGWLMRAGDL